MNSRLDTIQAAILLEKLKIFPEEIEMREAVARRYNTAFSQSNRIRVPFVVAVRGRLGRNIQFRCPTGTLFKHPWEQRGCPSAIYYPIPLSQQKGYSDFLSAPVQVSERISKSVVSLPMHPYLAPEAQDHIIDFSLGGRLNGRLRNCLELSLSGHSN